MLNYKDGNVTKMESFVDIVVHGARLVKIFDTFYDRQSPFCEISVDNQLISRTRTNKEGNTQPLWKERFGVKIPPNAQFLILRVLIEHSVRTPTLCGECNIPVTAIPVDKLTDFALQLTKRNEKTGEIDVTIQNTINVAKAKARIGQQLLAQAVDAGAEKPGSRPTEALAKALIAKGDKDALKRYVFAVFAIFDTVAPVGVLDFTEYKNAFLHILNDMSMRIPDGKDLIRIFKKYDVDGDGVLNREDFYKVVEIILERVRSAARDEEAKAPAVLPPPACIPKGAPVGAQNGNHGGNKNTKETPVAEMSYFGQEYKNERRFVDSYSWGKKLGQGAFGVVYLAKHRTTKFERVCKVVNKAKAQMPMSQIKSEAKVLAKLDHPHIIRVYEYFEDAENFYFIFDPCDGGELSGVLKQANDRNLMLTEAWVGKVMIGTLSALAYVHKCHIIHKDLKLQNVLLSSKTSPYEDPHAIVIDFGLAEMFQDDKNNRTVAGTPAYMAPEVWQHAYGPKCDVWSSGVMIFFLLAGTLPFAGKSIPDLRSRIQQGMVPWDYLAPNSAEAKDLLQRMLQVDDAKRPSASRCLGHAWFQDQTKMITQNVVLSKDILQNLTRVSEMEDFAKMVSNLVAKQMPNKQMNEITDIFKAMDTDNNGILTTDELAIGLRKIGIDEATIPNLIRALDHGQTGYISYTDFCGGMIAGILQDRDHLLWIGFQQLDREGTGRIEAKNLGRVLRTQGIANKRVSADEVIKEIAQDDEYVTWDAFRAYFRRQSTDIQEMVSYHEPEA